MAGVFTPYSTGAEFFGQKPSWIPSELDIMRIQSYQAYEEIYWNVPDVFKVSLRGSNSLPLFIPSAMTIVETTNRYYGTDLRVVCSPSPLEPGTAETVAAAQLAIKQFMKREKYRSKFNGKKRYGLIQGDSIWHLTADESKPVGMRLRLTSLDPGMYFPIVDEDDVDRVVGCHLVETVSTADGERIRRQTYRKTENGGITIEDAIFKLDDWEGPEAKPERVIQPPTPLPPAITSIPVYHTKNTEEPGNPFGSSEVRGFERILGGLNQAVSDESLALALMGIGMYATDASQPTDPRTRQLVPWQLGPGRVVHHDGTRFDKIQGVSGLNDSYGAHYDRLWDALKKASGTPDIAIGSVDVQIAQSGVALALQMSPMLAKAGEKNDLLLSTEDQLWYDILNMWMPAYEQTSFPGVTTDCAVSNGIPLDREARFQELNDMYDRGLIDGEYYRLEASKLGYTFPAGIGERATAEFKERQAMTDGFADRAAEEAGTGEDDGSAE